MLQGRDILLFFLPSPQPTHRWEAASKMVSTDPCLLEFIPCVVSSHTVTGVIYVTSSNSRSKGMSLLKHIFIQRLCPPLSLNLCLSVSLSYSSLSHYDSL